MDARWAVCVGKKIYTALGVAGFCMVEISEVITGSFSLLLFSFISGINFFLGGGRDEV